MKAFVALILAGIGIGLLVYAFNLKSNFDRYDDRARRAEDSMDSLNTSLYNVGVSNEIKSSRMSRADRTPFYVSVTMGCVFIGLALLPLAFLGSGSRGRPMQLEVASPQRTEGNKARFIGLGPQHQPKQKRKTLLKSLLPFAFVAAGVAVLPVLVSLIVGGNERSLKDYFEEGLAELEENQEASPSKSAKEARPLNRSSSREINSVKSLTPEESLREIASKGAEQAKKGLPWHIAKDGDYKLDDYRVEVASTGSQNKPYGGRVSLEVYYMDDGEKVTTYLHVFYWYQNGRWVAQWFNRGSYGYYVKAFDWREVECPEEYVKLGVKDFASHPFLEVFVQERLRVKRERAERLAREERSKQGEADMAKRCSDYVISRSREEAQSLFDFLVRQHEAQSSLNAASVQADLALGRMPTPGVSLHPRMTFPVEKLAPICSSYICDRLNRSSTSEADIKQQVDRLADEWYRKVMAELQ